MVNNVHMLEVDIVLTCILFKNVVKNTPITKSKAICNVET